jgi:outer membrane protein TolC
MEASPVLDVFVALALLAGAQEPQEITLEAAIAASAGAASVAGAAAAERAAEGREAQAEAARLPGVRVGGTLDVWNHAQEIVFPLPGAPPEPFEVRSQVTAGLNATAAMPLTGQFALGQRENAAESGIDAARAQEAGALAEARFQAADAWYAALAAERQLEIAEAQVKSLEARVAAAETAFRSGTITRNEVLTAQLALARARQAVLQGGVVRDAARGRLGLAIANGGVPVRPAAQDVPEPRSPADPEALVTRAMADRPELASLRAQVAAADAGAHAASLDRLPNLTAVATYLHTEGQGPFAEANAGFVGATLDWPVWAWGAKTAALDVARAGTDQQRAALSAAEAGLRVDVRNRVAALAASVAGWHLAEESVAQAEENLRIQDTLRAAGSGTMTELLDAEAALVEARSRTAAALYDAHRAEAALARAIGSDPWAQPEVR